MNQKVTKRINNHRFTSKLEVGDLVFHRLAGHGTVTWVNPHKREYVVQFAKSRFKYNKDRRMYDRTKELCKRRDLEKQDKAQRKEALKCQAYNNQLFPDRPEGNTAPGFQQSKHSTQPKHLVTSSNDQKYWRPIKKMKRNQNGRLVEKTVGWKDVSANKTNTEQGGSQ